MGREIRKVPIDWEHPKNDNGDYKTLYDEDFESAATEWKKGFQKWEDGERPSYIDDFEGEFWEWDSGPPDREYYRPKWTDEERTHYQIYETVSEGSPVSPVFATKEGMIEYLVSNGDYWDQKRGSGGRSREAAEAFVESGFAFSMIIGPSGIREGIDTAIKEIG